MAFDLEKWGPLLFAKLGGNKDFGKVIEEMNQYVGFLPIEEFSFSTAQSKDYLVNAHWALYCDNFLEGFHIPFVHKDLNDVLDYGSYETVIGEYFNLQVGYSEGAEDIFDLPEGHIPRRKENRRLLFLGVPKYDVQFLSLGTLS